MKRGKNLNTKEKVGLRIANLADLGSPQAFFPLENQFVSFVNRVTDKHDS